jgi:hypothetical protein
MHSKENLLAARADKAYFHEARSDPRPNTDWVARYGRVREVLEQLSQACLARLQQRET